MIIEESVHFMSCEPFFGVQLFLCGTHGIYLKVNEVGLVSYDNLSSVSQNVLKFYQQLTGEERRVPFIFGWNNR
jgi:hypothetical protein